MPNGQSAGPVTYATILPDDMPQRESDSSYITRRRPDSTQRREQERQMMQRRGDDGNHEYSNDHGSGNAREKGSYADETDQKSGNRDNNDVRGAVKAGIQDNKMLAYGLLAVVAVLLIIIAWQVMQQKKLADEAKAKVAIQPPSGPDQQQLQYQQDQQSDGNSEEEQPHPNARQHQPRATAEGKQAARNDKILGQQQHRRVLAPAGTRGAMAQARSGRRKADDRQRMEAVMEEADDGVDEVGSNMRAMIQRSLQEEAAAEEDGHRLGEGSPEVVDADTIARKELRREQIDSKMAGNPSGEARDEALAQPEDFEREEEEEQAVQLCDYILQAGSRSGQECQADCKPGKTRCTRHLKAK